MFKHPLFKLTASLFILIAGGTGIYVYGNQQVRWTFNCLTTQFPPEEFIVNKPIRITTEWQEFEVPSQIKPIGAIAAFSLYASPLNYSIAYDPSDPEYKHIQVNGGFTNKENGRPLVLYVKLLNQNNRAVLLSQNSLGLNHGHNPPTPFVSFGLTHDEWESSYFSPAVRYKKIAIKASEPLELTSITWEIPGYCKNGSRDWTAIEPSKLYEFERPSPPQTIDDRTPSELSYPKNLYQKTEAWEQFIPKPVYVKP